MKLLKYELIVIVLMGLLAFGLQPQVFAQSPITVSITSPSETFTISDQFVPIVGTVVFDPALMQYWKIEVRSRAARGFVLLDPTHRIPARDWVTIEATRTDTVVDGTLAVLSGWPTLSPGQWHVRLVVVAHDNTFLVEPIEIPFDVDVPDFDPVYVNISFPSTGSVITDNSAVTGTIVMNQFASAYRLEVLGGPYIEWTEIGEYPNNVAHPTIIDDAPLGNIPLSELPPGQYRLRLIVLGLDRNYLQEPVVVSFAIGSADISNLATVEIVEPRDSNGRVSVRESEPLIGTVLLPEGAAYYKVEIIDDPHYVDEPPSFPNWTTVGDIHTNSVVNGQLEMLPGPALLPPRHYLLRIVIVNPDGNFSGDPYEVPFRVREPD